MTCAPRVVGERLPSRTSTMRSSSIVTLAPDVTPGVTASMRLALVRTRRAVAAMAQERFHAQSTVTGLIARRRGSTSFAKSLMPFSDSAWVM